MWKPWRTYKARWIESHRVDGISKTEYGKNLEFSLKELGGADHKGSTQPLKSKGSFHSKADGRKGRWPIACLNSS